MTTLSNNFDKQLTLGERAEQYVLEKIKKKYPKAHKMDGNFKAYDIYIPEVDKKVEVKFDEKSKETGNVAIEFRFKGQPSGIDTTLADYWAILYFHEGNFSETFITVKDLKEMISNYNLPRVTGGDDNLSDMVLLPTNDLELEKIYFRPFLESGYSSNE